ncbi:MAG: HTH domain-containing protein [Treponema sp.]
MGNNTTSTKYKVLELLRSNRDPVSGELIAGQTGVSRVSVWKAVQSLQAAGYGITSTKNGYQLTHDLPDSLFPWEFGNEEQLFSHFTKTESTMLEARRIVESEEDGNQTQIKIVTADRQTKGHGQNNHSWTTTEGSLAYTVITHSHLPAAASHRMTMASQVALANVLKRKTDRQFYVRWPNDIWTDKGKAGGLLDELSSSGGICRWINIGIGLNMITCPHIPASDCVSPDGCLSRKELLLSFRDEFRKQEKLAQSDSDALASEWNSLCCDSGATVRFMHSGEEHLFRKINGWGWAVFDSPDTGTETVLPPGTVRFIKSK